MNGRARAMQCRLAPRASLPTPDEDHRRRSPSYIAIGVEPVKMPSHVIAARPFSARAMSPLLACLLALVVALASATAPASFFLTLHTTVPYRDGKIVLHLNRSLAPLGVDRLWELAQANYYVNNSFFRVLPGFVVQFGICGDPAISRYWDQLPIQDDPVAASNLAGTIAYATAGNDTRTTQLFINYVDNTHLDAVRIPSALSDSAGLWADVRLTPCTERLLAARPRCQGHGHRGTYFLRLRPDAVAGRDLPPGTRCELRTANCTCEGARRLVHRTCASLTSSNSISAYLKFP